MKFYFLPFLPFLPFVPFLPQNLSSIKYFTIVWLFVFPGVLGISTENDNKVDIDKCCPLGTVVEISDDFKGDWAFCTEVSQGVNWSPYFYREIQGFFQNGFQRTNTTERGKKIVPNYLISEMDCKPFRVLSTKEDAPEGHFAQFRVLNTGVIWARERGEQKWYKLEKNDKDDFLLNYCIDGLIVSNNFDPNVVSNASFVPSEDSQVILMCMDTVQQAKVAIMRGTINTLNFCLITFISIFLAITVIIYLLIWDQLNVHGWTKGTVSFCILMYALLLIIKIGDLISTGRSLIPLESHACIALGILIHYFCIAMFSWQSVLNYDIWATITAKTWKPDGNKGKKRFVLYCTAGFGIPMIVVGISIIMDNAFGSTDDYVIRPQYGRLACAADPIAYFYYVLIIRKILFGFNILFAFLVIRFMYRYKKEAAFLKKFNFDNKGGRGSYNQGFLFFKLFALMGLSLLAEVVQWFIDKTNHPTWYWAVLGVYNIIQPIFFFWIFVCNSEIKRKLCYKYQLFQDFCDWIEEKRQECKSSGDVSSLTVEPSSPTRKHETSDSL